MLSVTTQTYIKNITLVRERSSILGVGQLPTSEGRLLFQTMSRLTVYHHVATTLLLLLVVTMKCRLLFGWVVPSSLLSSHSKRCLASTSFLYIHLVSMNASESAYDISSKYTWNERVQQLHTFIEEHGHTRVPKRYPGLGNWVNKQRQNYRKHVQGERSSITKAQIDILNSLGFCWDASNGTTTERSNAKEKDHDGIWWYQLTQLKDALNASGVDKVALIPRCSSALRRWIDEQREEFSHGTNTIERAQRFEALEQLDTSWYMTRRELLWEKRYRELVDYRKRYGDCNVPISFEENKALAHWVSNQRKQYNLLQKKRFSNLTKQRKERLEAIGFVWNRWEDAFENHRDPAGWRG